MKIKKKKFFVFARLVSVKNLMTTRERNSAKKEVSRLGEHFVAFVKAAHLFYLALKP